MNTLENGKFYGQNSKHAVPFEDKNGFFIIQPPELPDKVREDGVRAGWLDGLLPGKVISHEKAQKLIRKGKGRTVVLYDEGVIINRIPLDDNGVMQAVARHKHEAPSKVGFPEGFGGLPSVIGEMSVEWEIVDLRIS